MAIKNTKAVVYARFSPRKNAADCESIETQIDFCTNYIMFQHWEVIGIHEDRAISGAKCDNRPGLISAIEEAIKNKAVLVVYSLSRLSRSTKDAIEISSRLEKARANLCSVTENIDTTTAMGSAFFQIIAVLAELERKQISERTRDAMKFHQSQGRRMSKIPPYGWQDDPDNPARMIPEDTELKIINRIVEYKNRGYTLRRIADTLALNNHKPRMVKKKIEGVPFLVAGRWHHGLIRNILNRVDPELIKEIADDK